MKTIHKYEVPVLDDFTIKLPKGAQILCVQVQSHAPMIWAIVDDDAQLEVRRFSVVGTGHKLRGYDYRYLGTFQLHKVSFTFVGHLFEINL